MQLPFYFISSPDDQQLSMFKLNYERLSGSYVELDYLKKAAVYIFYEGPEMVGGFVLSSASNGNVFRYFSIFEDASAQKTLLQLKKLFQIDEAKSLEIGCIWMKKKKSILVNRAYFYKILALETMKLVKIQRLEYIFGGAIEPHTQRFQSYFLDKIFYQGIKPMKEEGVLKNQEGKLVMLYFIRAKEAKITFVKLLLQLYRADLRNKSSKLLTKFLKWKSNLPKRLEVLYS